MARVGLRFRGHSVVVALSIAVVMIGTPSCGTDDDPVDLVTMTFNRWNALARSGDPKVAELVCDNPPTEDEYSTPILVGHRGFAAPADLNVQVNGDTATVDFMDPGTQEDGDEEDVFVTVVNQRGSWRVCQSQITAAGGIG